MFGDFLLQYRLKNGMTQTDLARKLSVSQNAVSQYESGKRVPTVKRISSIASALGCSVADIMTTFDATQPVRTMPSTNGETEQPSA